MGSLFQQFRTWFDSLGERDHLDVLVLDYSSSLVEWLAALSLNQWLVLLGFVGVALLFLLFMFKVVARLCVGVRRWLRRRRIPDSINLYLDSERNDLKYGRNLRRNIEKMREEAPFRKD